MPTSSTGVRVSKPDVNKGPLHLSTEWNHDRQHLATIRTIEIQDHTYRRLSAILDEITHLKRKDITLDDVINELIDIYQDNSWSQAGAGAGGG